jgi:hypothetical protein
MSNQNITFITDKERVGNSGLYLWENRTHYTESQTSLLNHSKTKKSKE